MDMDDEEKILTQLYEVKYKRGVYRRKRYKRSRLDRFRAEIEIIHKAGGSWRDIAIWLRQYRNMKVHPTTVGRALASWQGKEE
jgi:hypothetical protein